MSRLVAVVTATVLTLALAAAASSIGAGFARADSSNTGAAGLTLSIDPSAGTDVTGTSPNFTVPAAGGLVSFVWAWANANAYGSPGSYKQTFSQSIPAGMVWQPATYNTGTGCSLGTKSDGSTQDISSGETLTCVVSIADSAWNQGGSIEKAALVYSLANNTRIDSSSATVLSSGISSARMPQATAPQTLTVQANLNLLGNNGNAAITSVTHMADPNGSGGAGYNVTWTVAMGTSWGASGFKGSESLDPSKPISTTVSITDATSPTPVPWAFEWLGCGTGRLQRTYSPVSNGTVNCQLSQNPNAATGVYAAGTTVTLTVTNPDSTYLKAPQGSTTAIFAVTLSYFLPAAEFTKNTYVAFNQTPFTVWGLDGKSVQLGAVSGNTRAGVYTQSLFSLGGMNPVSGNINPGDTVTPIVSVNAPEQFSGGSSNPSTNASVCEVWDPNQYQLTGPVVNPSYTVEYATFTPSGSSGPTAIGNSAAACRAGASSSSDEHWYDYNSLIAGPGLSSVTAIRMVYYQTVDANGVNLTSGPSWTSSGSFPAPTLKVVKTGGLPSQLVVYGSAWDDQTAWPGYTTNASPNYYGQYSPVLLGVTSKFVSSIDSISAPPANVVTGTKTAMSITPTIFGTSSNGAILTVTSPNACAQLVKPGPYVVGGVSISPTLTGDPSSTCTNAGQTLVWNLPAFDYTTKTTLPPITFFISVSATMPVLNPLTVSTTLSTTLGVAPNQATITTSTSSSINLIANANSVISQVTSSTQYAQHDVPFTYGLTWYNGSANDYTIPSGGVPAAYLIDLLPANNDNRQTSLGSSGLVLGSVNGLPTGGTVEYTTDNVSSVITVMSSANPISASINWTSSQSLTKVTTAIRIGIPTVLAGKGGSVNVNVTPPSDFTQGQQLVNTVLFVPSASPANALISSPVVTQSATTTLSGTVFNDPAYSGSGSAAISAATVSLSASGTVLQTATTDANGNFSFTVDPGSYTLAVTSGVTGLYLLSSPGTSSVAAGVPTGNQNFVFQPTLDKPQLAQSSAVNVSQGQQVSIPIGSYVTDRGDAAGATSQYLLSGSGGTLSSGTITANTTVPFTASANWPAATGASYGVPLTLTVTNKQGVSSSTTINVTVYETPSAVVDDRTVSSISSTDLNVLINDTGDQLTLTGTPTVGQPSSGTYASAATAANSTAFGVLNVVHYTPPTGYAWAPGQTSFTQTITYYAKDSQGVPVTGTVHLTVVRPPVATAATPLTVSAHGTPSIDVQPFFSSYFGAGSVTISLGTPVGDDGNSYPGLAAVSGTQVGLKVNTLTNLSVTIPYFATDSLGQIGGSTVTVTFAKALSVTDAGPLAATVSGTALSIPLSGNLSGSSVHLVPGQTFSIVANSAACASCGSVAIDTSDTTGQTLTYTPGTQAGAMSFSYTVIDAAGATAVGNVSLSLYSAPTAVPDSRTIPADGGPQDIDVLTNDTGGDAPLSIKSGSVMLSGGTSLGSVAIVSDRGQDKVEYTPATGYSWAAGQTSYVQEISYVGMDSLGAVESTAGKLTITVVRAPVLATDSVTVSAGAGTTQDVLRNDSWFSGDPVTLSVGTPTSTSQVSFPDHFAIMQNQKIVVASSASFAGIVVTIPYTVTDTVTNQTSSSTLVVTYTNVLSASDLGPFSDSLGNTTALPINALTGTTGSSVSLVPGQSISVTSGSLSCDAVSCGTVAIDQNHAGYLLYSHGTSTGDFSVTYTVQDELGVTTTGTGTVHVYPIPVAATHNVTLTAGGGQQSIDVLTADQLVNSDLDGALSLSAAALTGDAMSPTGSAQSGSGDVVTVGADQHTIYYTPGSGYHWATGQTYYTQQISYVANDGLGVAENPVGTVTVTVVRAPVLSDDPRSVTVSAGAATSVDVLTGANWYSGDAIRVTVGTVSVLTGVTAPTVTVGSQSQNKNQILIAAGASLVDTTITIPYTVHDDTQNQSTSGTLHVSYLKTLTAPSVGDSTHPFVVVANAVTAIPLSPGGSSPSLLALSPSVKGVQLSWSGLTVSYYAGQVPVGSTPVDDSFTYTVTDGIGTATGTVYVRVDPAPLAPSVGSSTNAIVRVKANANNPAVYTLPASGSNLSVTLIPPATGSLATGLTNQGLVVSYDARGITPTNPEVDSFTYTVTDTLSGATSSPGTVWVQIDPVPTVASYGTSSLVPVSSNGTYKITLKTSDSSMSGVGVHLDQSFTSSPECGTVNFTGTNELTYTPSCAGTVSVSFSYRVVDELGATAIGTAHLSVLAHLNAVDDLTVKVHGGDSIQLDQVLLALDSGDRSMFVSSVSTIRGGTSSDVLALDSSSHELSLQTGTVSTTKTMTFTYTAEDASGATSSATVEVTVTPLLSTTAHSFDSTASGRSLIPVLETDVGDALSFSAASGPAGTTVTQAGNDLAFTPDPGHVWTTGQTDYVVTLLYTAKDSWGDTKTGTVTVTVWRAPVTVTHTENIHTGETASVDVLGLDPDLVSYGPASIDVTGWTGPGSASRVGGTTTITFDSTPGMSGPYSISYTLTDGLRQSTAGTFSGTVAAPLTLISSPTLTSTPGGVTIPDPLEYVSGTGLAFGSVTRSPTHGSLIGLTYSPVTGFTGSDSFDYTVTDIAGGSITVPVSITVSDVPVAADLSVSTALGTAATIDVLSASQFFAGSGTGVLKSVAQPTSGTTSISTDHKIQFVPATVGTFSFDYTVSDEATVSSTGTVTVIVTSSSQPTLTVTLGADHTSFILDGQGLPSGADWSAEMHSTPIHLASGTIGSAGTLHQVISLPKNPSPGNHRLVITGLPVNGSSTFTFYFVIMPDGLAYTGADAAPWVLAGAALLGGGVVLLALVAWLRRKRNNVATLAV